MKPDSWSADGRSLDETMSRGWKALEEEFVDGWIVRFSHAVTRRANSVLPLGEPGDLPAAIEYVEAAYRRRALPSVFQISDEALPANLDALLATRGYLLASPTLVQLLDGAAFSDAVAADPDPRITLAGAPAINGLKCCGRPKAPGIPPHRKPAD